MMVFLLKIIYASTELYSYDKSNVSVGHFQYVWLGGGEITQFRHCRRGSLKI